MSHDPLVQEIHQIRAKLVEESGGDLDRFLDQLEAAERQETARLVTEVPTQDGKPKRTPRVRRQGKKATTRRR
jgi:hypothetical protein